MTSTHRLSGSGPEPFEACPDGGRCWHGCPLAVATLDHPEGEGLPCWRVANASPMGDAVAWPEHVRERHGLPGDPGIHEVDQRALDALGDVLVPEVRDRLLVALSEPRLAAQHAVHAWGETYTRIARVVASLMAEAAEQGRAEEAPKYAAFDRGYALGLTHGIDRLTNALAAHIEADGVAREVVDTIDTVARDLHARISG